MKDEIGRKLCIVQLKGIIVNDFLEYGCCCPWMQNGQPLLGTVEIREDVVIRLIWRFLCSGRSRDPLARAIGLHVFVMDHCSCNARAVT